MVMGYTSGQMVASIKVIGTKIKYQVMASIIGMMEELTMDTGWITICMDREFINGQTAGNTRVITSMIKSMELVFIPTQMEDRTKVNGPMGNNMVMEPSSHRQVSRDKAPGQMERGLNGMTRTQIINILSNENKEYSLK